MTPLDIHSAAAALGRKGGQSTSEAKQAAARENGKLGGRKMGTKMHTVTFRYPKKLNGKTGEFERWVKRERKFSNFFNAKAWAMQQEADIEECYGNRWPTSIKVDGENVFDAKSIVF